MQKPLDSNVIGKIILEDIFSNNNVLLMKAGTELTKSLIERLQKYNIVQAMIQDEVETEEQNTSIVEKAELQLSE